MRMAPAPPHAPPPTVRPRPAAAPAQVHAPEARSRSRCSGTSRSGHPSSGSCWETPASPCAATPPRLLSDEGLRMSRQRGGQAIVEFALIIPVFFTIFIGVIEVGRLMAVWISLQQGAQEAARLGSISSNTENQIFLA